MINQFKKYISNNNLIQPKDKLLLAISGGIDSVVMLDLFSKIKMQFAIAHCNFKLRGNESDGDEELVKKLSKKYNVEIFDNVCDASDYSKVVGLSIQESARELRYNWFNKVCLENNFSNIVIGHNQDDKTETFLINLFRGAGIKGLKSIPVKRDNIIRPLMFATRSQIVKYAQENNLEYREDSSNSSDYYLRNNIRHHLIPKIKEVSPGFSKSVQKSIDNLNDSFQLLQSAIDEKKNKLFSKDLKNNIRVSIVDVLKLKPYSIWVYYLLKEFGFSRQITDAICYSLQNKEQNIGSKFSSSDYELLIDRDFLIVRKTTNKSIFNKVEISKVKTKIDDPVKMNMESQKNTLEFVFSKSNSIAYFDIDKLNFPLTIRRWQVGDRMVPFGMNGSKLVSDILINNKVNSFDKENTYVLLSGKKIIWLVGHRTSNETRVKKSTKSIYVVTLVNSDLRN